MAWDKGGREVLWPQQQREIERKEEGLQPFRGFSEDDTLIVRSGNMGKSRDDVRSGLGVW